MKNLVKDLTINIFIGIIWLISVLSFLQIIPISLLFLLILLGIIYFFTLIFRVHLFSNLLIYTIILSPIFGSISFLKTNLLFSDILLVFAIFILLLKGIYPKNTKFFYLVFFLLICHFFIHFIIGDLVKIKPLISIIEIFSVYYISKETLKLRKNNTFIFSIIISITLGIVLMFFAFYKGINLNDFEGDNKALINDALEIDLRNYRMSYFYTSFPFLISTLVFIFIFYIDKVKKILYKTLIIFFILLICLSLVASGNKTVMITTLFVFIISNFIFNGKSIYRNKNILILFLFLPFLNIVISKYFLNEYNSILFSDRMFSLDSFEDRIGVYINVIDLFSKNTFRIIVGYGADFLTTSGDLINANKFKINYYTKAEQGAVDSGIFTFFIEFGLFYFFLFTYIIYKRVKYLFLNHNLYSILTIQIFLIFILSSLTQIVGLSKIFWFFVLIYVFSKPKIAEIYVNENNFNHITK